MIFNQNALWVGLLIGLVLPFVGYALLLTVYEQLEAMGVVSKIGFTPYFRERTIGIVAICLNIFPLNVFYKKRFTQSMRGVMIPTFLYVALWVFYFGKYVF
jgi:hypothetical protein